MPSLFSWRTPSAQVEKIVKIYVLFVRFCLFLELTYYIIFVLKTSRNWRNQGVFRPALFGFAAVAASRYNASCDGSGPRGLGFESRHSDQIRKSTHWVGFLIWMGWGIRKAGTSPVDCCIGRGRIPWFLDAPLAGVNRNQVYVFSIVTIDLSSELWYINT